METELHAGTSADFTLRSADGSVRLSFELAALNLTPEQESIVAKLLRQNPKAVVVDEAGRHSMEAERGKRGPGSDYLTEAEFEEVRRLGVRLGTRGDLVATVCDFCLHCVKLEAMEGWEAGFSV